jgi:hypothetical protein
MPFITPINSILLQASEFTRLRVAHSLHFSLQSTGRTRASHQTGGTTPPASFSGHPVSSYEAACGGEAHVLPRGRRHGVHAVPHQVVVDAHAVEH